jgi:calcineurin-like phosphoesterase family protein
MVNMSTRQRIVSYETLAGAFDPYLEQAGAVLSGLEGTASEVPPAPIMSQISDGLQVLELAKRNPDVMGGTEHAMASLLQTYFAERAVRTSRGAGDGLEAKFDNDDLLGWIGSFFTWWKKITPHAWQNPVPKPTVLANDCRIALFGDWGTGLYGAPVLARSIAADQKSFQLVLHLGDTYYSGDDGEIKERLLEPWPKVPGALNRTLNGNHEMYTGGHAYFDNALKQFSQPSSCFALENDHWILACLDSAYTDHDLYGEQVAWLDAIVAEGDNRRLILFSHHQPYSLLDVQGPKLVAKLSTYLENRKIFAWYWGHEHHCVLYDEHPAWGLYGRCIGHGGFPYFRETDFGSPPAKPSWVRLETKNLVPGAEVLDGPNPFIPGHEKEYGPHGYVILELQGPRLNELVLDADGSVLRSQELGK